MSTTQVQGKSELELPAFTNEPIFPGCDDPQVKAGFGRAIAQVREQLGRTYRLYINGRNVVTDDIIDSINPADPGEVIGHICQAGTREIEEALTAAQKAFQTWRDTSPAERAEYLVKAAKIARERIYEYCAWQILEEGKQ